MSQQASTRYAAKPTRKSSSCAVMFAAVVAASRERSLEGTYSSPKNPATMVRSSKTPAVFAYRWIIGLPIAKYSQYTLSPRWKILGRTGQIGALSMTERASGSIERLARVGYAAKAVRGDDRERAAEEGRAHGLQTLESGGCGAAASLNRTSIDAVRKCQRVRRTQCPHVCGNSPDEIERSVVLCEDDSHASTCPRVARCRVGIDPRRDHRVPCGAAREQRAGGGLAPRP